MNRQVLLPSLGFVTVHAALPAGGAFDGVPLADRAGAFVLGLVAVTAPVAGYSSATANRADGGADAASDPGGDRGA